MIGLLRIGVPLFFCSAAVALIGCGCSKRQDESPEAAPAGEAVTMDYPGETSARLPTARDDGGIPVRGVLFSGQEAPAGYGAYGYLVFTKRPSAQTMSHYLTICQAFVGNLESVSAYHDFDRASLMPTYWLAVTDAAIDDEVPDCNEWIENYDYARAKVLAVAISALDSDGPLLVAWSTPFERVVDGEEALVFDLSGFADEDLDRAFGIWMDRIARDPEVWHDGFELVRAREAVRSFLERYGDHVVRAIGTIKERIG